MQPFANIKVLDLTHVLAGPFCAYQLSVMGAEVIKIEAPDNPDMSRDSSTVKKYGVEGMGTGFLTQGSNKRGLTLNIKTKKGQEILKKLVAGADVMVENYTAGALERLGLGWKDLEPINPRLIYCSMTGFGQNGPKRGHPAFDSVIQAVSGLMSITGTPESAPLKVGSPMFDYGTGIMAAFAVSCALFQRVQSGKGQRIDVSMLDAAFMLMSSTMCGFLTSGSEPKLRGNDRDHALSACYPTKDGLIMLSASRHNLARNFWNAVGNPDRARRSSGAKEEQTDEQRAEMAAEVSTLMMQKTADEWVEILNAAHVPAERVRNVRDAATHPQVAHRGVFHTHKDLFGPGEDVTVPVAAFSFEHDGPSIRSKPPKHGEHTDEILRGLGISREEIGGLRAEGVI